MKQNILMPIMTFMTRFYHSCTHTCRFFNVSHIHLQIFILAIFLLSLISCEEKPTTFGNDILPESDFATIISTDTLSVWSFTDFDDSVRTDNQNIALLGQIRDPYFGTTTCEFVSQVRLRPAWDKKPYVIDSVKLYLRVLHMKGPSDAGNMLNISEISDQIYTDSAYYSKRPVKTTGYSVSVALPILKKDSINDIVIDMPISFGEYLLRDTSMLFYSNTKPDFRSYLKGFYFQISQPSDPTLISMSVESPSLGGDSYNFFTIFLHEENVLKETYFILDAVNENARYNRFLHDLTTADPDKMIEHVNDGYRDTLSYLQYLNGVYTRLTFPGLENFKKSLNNARVSVNKGSLSIPVFLDGVTFKGSTVPSSLNLRYKTKDGYKYDVPDYYVDQDHKFFNGNLDSINKVYNFNIAYYVNSYLLDATGTIKPELEVYQFETGTKNVILKANNNKTPVKFEFTYTKF
jgi:hypothetical protein